MGSKTNEMQYLLKVNNIPDTIGQQHQQNKIRLHAFGGIIVSLQREPNEHRLPSIVCVSVIELVRTVVHVSVQ